MFSANERGVVPEYKVFGQAPTEQDRVAVHELLEQFKLVWSNEDTEGLMALYSDDIEWINAYARIFRGKEKLAPFLRDVMFPGFKSSVSRNEINNMKAISLRYIGDKVAIFHGYTDGNRGASVIKGRKLRRTHFHFVLEKHEDGWKFVHKAVSDAR